MAEKPIIYFDLYDSTSNSDHFHDYQSLVDGETSMSRVKPVPEGMHTVTSEEIQ